jgi:hypothetical protein
MRRQINRILARPKRTAKHSSVAEAEQASGDGDSVISSSQRLWLVSPKVVLHPVLGTGQLQA